MQRVLFIFDITKRSAGKAQSLRLSKADWATECDIACLAAHILEEMQKHRDENNQIVFPQDTVATLMGRFIDG